MGFFLFFFFFFFFNYCVKKKILKVTISEKEFFIISNSIDYVQFLKPHLDNLNSTQITSN